MTQRSPIHRRGAHRHSLGALIAVAFVALACAGNPAHGQAPNGPAEPAQTVTTLAATTQTATTQTAQAATEIWVGFWNLENLFDTEDDKKNSGDDEFLPANGWTPERYGRKLAHLAEIITELDCHLLGFSEIENSRVLEDLIQQKGLADKGYKIAHIDSPDKRGIDLGVIYRSPVTVEDAAKAVRLHPIPISPPTRGVLEFQCQVSGNDVVFLVNHWPSRRGGTTKSRPLRQAAAETTKQVVRAAIDRSGNKDADVIVVGDFNDDPFDPSVRYHLGAIRNAHAVKNRTDKKGPYRLYNPTWTFFGQPGMGTLYYNSEWVWNLFDQVIVSRGLLDDKGLQFVEGSLDIYGPDKMRDKYRRPLRFRKKGRNSEEWNEGYSDHLPIRGRFRVMGDTAKEAGKPDSNPKQQSEAKAL